MGYIDHQIPANLFRTRQRSAYPVSEGILYSVAVTLLNPQPVRAIGWAEIGIANNDLVDSPKLSIICSGHIGSPGSLSWTGRLPIVTENYIYVDIYAMTATPGRLSILLLKPDPNLNSMQVLDA